VTKTAGTSLNVLLTAHSLRIGHSMLQCYDDEMPVDIVDPRFGKCVPPSHPSARPASHPKYEALVVPLTQRYSLRWPR